MVKLKKNFENSPPISRKVLKLLQKHQYQKIINIDDLRDAKLKVKEAHSSTVSTEQLQHMDPFHAVYVCVQNQLSVMGEQLLDLPPMIKINNAIFDADEEYMPSGPPTSPLTYSYFFCWSFFDFSFGNKKETLGTILFDMCSHLSVDDEFLKVLKVFNNSRMGLYIHEGLDSKGLVNFRELVTNKKIKAHISTDYKGVAGELWYIRMLSDPALNAHYSTVFTTPYIIARKENTEYLFASEKEWLACLDRNLEKTGCDDKTEAYEHLMKWGLESRWWNEFIFEGFVNFTPDMILLTGFPDISTSRPHSPDYSGQLFH